MPDTLADLRALIADVGAVLEDTRLRGVVAEYEDEPLPAAIAPAPDVAPRTKRPAVSSSWAKLAERGRDSADEATPSGARGLKEIRNELGDCRRCNLCTSRSRIVFGVGDPSADLAIIGGAPDYAEDRQGEPFLGAGGEMLDRMLLHVLGLSREEVHLLTVVKCKPAADHRPEQDEVEACLPFLRRQIAAIQPKVILVTGSIALRALIDAHGDIARDRGQWLEFANIPVMPTFHPGYLVEQPGHKRETFSDLKAVLQRYEQLGGRRTKPAPAF